MTKEETRVHLMAGALSGLAGLSAEELDAFVGTNLSPKDKKRFVQFGRAGTIAILAGRVAKAAEAEL